MAKDELFKTVSFGGYDKAIVDEYVAETNRSHQNDVADLKTTIGKLSETVRSLQVAKEQVKTAASEDIEKLKLELESSFEQNDAVKRQLNAQTAEKEALQSELNAKQEEIADLQTKLDERIAMCIDLNRQLDEQRELTDEATRSGGDRLAAVQMAEAMARQESATTALREEYETKMQALRDEQSRTIEELREEYEAQISRIMAETEEKNGEYAGMAQELEAMREKEASYAGKYEAISKTLIEARERADQVVAAAEEESRRIAAQAEEERAELIQTTTQIQDEKMAQTEAECNELLQVTREQCQKMLSEAERQAAMIRLHVQEQCDNVNAHMETMMLTIDELARACNRTREIAAKGFAEFQEEEEMTAAEASDEETDMQAMDEDVQEAQASEYGNDDLNEI